MESQAKRPGYIQHLLALFGQELFCGIDGFEGAGDRQNVSGIEGFVT